MPFQALPSPEKNTNTRREDPDPNPAYPDVNLTYTLISNAIRVMDAVACRMSCGKLTKISNRLYMPHTHLLARNIADNPNPQAERGKLARLLL
jgi:hypothetical protein